MENEPWMIKAPFYGKWSMTVTAKNSARKQRVMIESLAGIENTVDGLVGQSIAEINFPQWYVLILSTEGGPGANASRIRRVPGVISPDGLIATLYSDDVPAGGADGDFNDLIVQFTYLNPEVNPPGVPPYEFTVPSGSFRPTRPGRDKPRCTCECACSCGPQKRSRRKRGCGC